MTVIAVVLAAAVTATATPFATAATTASADKLLRNIEDGTRSCSSLKTTDFNRIGEHVMGRMVGSSANHEIADQRMQQMMGTAGADSMHVQLGERFSDCSSRTARDDRLPDMFNGPGMMGNEADGYGMMSGNNRSSNDDNDWGMHGNSGWWMLMWFGGFLVLALAAAGVVALVNARTGRLPTTTDASPLNTLQQRLASGEISEAEYEHLRQLINQ